MPYAPSSTFHYALPLASVTWSCTCTHFAQHYAHYYGSRRVALFLVVVGVRR